MNSSSSSAGASRKIRSPIIPRLKPNKVGMERRRISSDVLAGTTSDNWFINTPNAKMLARMRFDAGFVKLLPENRMKIVSIPPILCGGSRDLNDLNQAFAEIAAGEDAGQGGRGLGQAVSNIFFVDKTMIENLTGDQTFIFGEQIKKIEDA